MRNISSQIERFLKSNDHCRLCTNGKDGFPHCVPIGYAYLGGRIYLPTNRRSVKVQNLRADSKCCMIVDVYQDVKARGVMLQGRAKLDEGRAFLRSKKTVESLTSWSLDEWRVGKRGRDRVDTIIVFEPERLGKIGRLS